MCVPSLCVLTRCVSRYTLRLSTSCLGCVQLSVLSNASCSHEMNPSNCCSKRWGREGGTRERERERGRGGERGREGGERGREVINSSSCGEHWRKSRISKTELR